MRGRRRRQQFVRCAVLGQPPLGLIHCPRQTIRNIQHAGAQSTSRSACGQSAWLAAQRQASSTGVRLGAAGTVHGQAVHGSGYQHRCHPAPCRAYGSRPPSWRRLLLEGRCWGRQEHLGVSSAASVAPLGPRGCSGRPAAAVVVPCQHASGSKAQDDLRQA